MNVLVNIRDKQEFFQVSGPHAPIHELVQLIHAVLCIAPVCQQLHFNGTAVDPSKTFAEYGIKDETSLYLTVTAGAFDELLLRLRGEGVSSVREVEEAIREVHGQTVIVHERISAVRSVRQYRYKAVYTCSENEPVLDVRETVLESDVSVVLSAFNKPTPEQLQQQQQQQQQQQPQPVIANEQVPGQRRSLTQLQQGFWDPIEPVYDLLNHHISYDINSWQDLCRVSEACCASAADYALQSEYLDTARAVSLLLEGHLRVCMSVHRRLLRVLSAVQPEHSRLEHLQGEQAKAMRVLHGMRNAGVKFEDAVTAPKVFAESTILHGIPTAGGSACASATATAGAGAGATASGASAIGNTGSGVGGVSSKLLKQLCEWLPEGSGCWLAGMQQIAATTSAPRLLYRGSRDGLTGQAFHSRCDDQGATLTVVRSKNGYVFGGYTSVTWKGNNGYVADASAFVFTLTNPANQPAKYVCATGNPYALYRGPAFGPTFGLEFCINLFGNSCPYTVLPSQSYIDTTGGGPASFTGERNYEIDEVEVWAV